MHLSTVSQNPMVSLKKKTKLRSSNSLLVLQRLHAWKKNKGSGKREKKGGDKKAEEVD